MKKLASAPSIAEQVDAEAQALVYAQQVAAGAKLAATLQVKSEIAHDVESVCAAEGCRCITDVQDGWAHTWIYKYPYVRLLIDEIKKRGAP